MPYNILNNLLKKIIDGIKNPLIKNMLLVGSITMLIKIISFYKETLIASIFGLSQILDTYFIAILIPTFIQNVFIGSLKNLFIPNYITEIKTTNNKGGFQSLVIIVILCLIIILSILALIFSEFFLEKVFIGHTVSYYNQVRNQLYIVLPCLIFWGLSGFISGLLEIDNRYLISTLSQILLPITTIVCLLFFKNYFEKNILAISILLGSLLSFLYLIIAGLHYKVIYLKSFLKINSNMLLMLKEYPPKLTSSLLTGINPFIDQFFAAQLVIGSIAAINYGTKLPGFTVSILLLAVGNVILPHFSKQINEDIEKAYKQLFKILKTIFFSSLTIAILMIFFSDYIIEILFERKEFTAENTYIVSNIQKIAFIYAPFYICTLVCVHFLTAINKNKFMAWVSFWNLILNIFLNIFFIRYYNVYGLVISTTIVYIICNFIYLKYVYKNYRLFKKNIKK